MQMVLGASNTFNSGTCINKLGIMVHYAIMLNLFIQVIMIYTSYLSLSTCCANTVHGRCFFLNAVCGR